MLFLSTDEINFIIWWKSMMLFGFNITDFLRLLSYLPVDSNDETIFSELKIYQFSQI